MTKSLAPQVDAFLSHFKGIVIESTDPLVITTYDDQYYLDAEWMVYSNHLVPCGLVRRSGRGLLHHGKRMPWVTWLMPGLIRKSASWPIRPIRQLPRKSSG